MSPKVLRWALDKVISENPFELCTVNQLVL